MRSHWSIENQLHWVLDVFFNENQARNRKDHGPQNLALLRKLALNLAKLEPSKGSMRGKLKRAGWDNAFLATMLSQFADPQMRWPCTNRLPLRPYPQVRRKNGQNQRHHQEVHHRPAKS